MSESRTDLHNVQGTSCNSPTIRNRLSLFLQLAPPGIAKSKPTYPRRSVTPSRRSSGKDAEAGLRSAVSLASDRPVFDGTASSVSLADSLVWAPHGSLLFKSQSTDVLLPPGTPPATSVSVPPTTNDLDAEEKMRLLKKMRKLSRVLGEYPLPVGADDATPLPGRISSGDAFIGSVPGSPIATVKAAKRKSFRHSWTGSCNAGAALAGPTPPPPEEVSPPGSPIEFAKLVLPDLSSTNSDPPSRPHSLDMTSVHSEDAIGVDSNSPTRSRRTSTGSASISLSLEKTPEQIQRARAARITRHLGDDVPPEILFRAASPPPPRPSSPLTPPPSGSSALPMVAPEVPSRPPAGGVVAAHVLNSQTLPRRSASLRRKKEPSGINRRLSLDLKALNSSTTSPPMYAGLERRPSTSSGTKGAKPEKRLVKRSRSMWVRKGRLDDGMEEFESLKKVATSPVRESFDAPSIAVEPMSERERVMNVKRAKKMTQYFGDQPPTALFQITNFTGDEDAFRLRRDSLATIISISSSMSLAQVDGRKVRDSYMSMSSALSSNTPSGRAESVSAVTAPTDLAPHQVQPTEDDDGTASIDGEPAEEAQYVFPLPPATPPPGASRLGSLSPPLSPSAGSTTVSVFHTPFHSPPSPRTPPPFSNIISPPPRTSSVKSNGSTASLVASPDAKGSSKDDSKTSLEFHTRQKRAAKLSKFFGVEMNTLAEVLPANPRQSAPVESRHASNTYNGSPGRDRDQQRQQRNVVSSDDVAPSAMVLESLAQADRVPASSRVEIVTEHGKGPLRFLHGQNARELDMNDAIEKLRRMKSV
ncbi:hypothetical protein EIP91_005596 [Steccherinum ochraceum]|uniref:Uncharacterized protein n=1 Tax=Steccherinum ochraceum TaxID=92696 RepID=A0A4R0RHZ9_9APHY|nr:hypothetical protein EIP91_005596 [Steccherinum ochraceum]